MICKNCGKEIKEGNTFCTNCGQTIDDIKNKEDNFNTNSGQKGLRKNCKKCGADIEEGANFCGKCGVKIKRNIKKIVINMCIILSILTLFTLISLYIYGKDLKVGEIKINNPMGDLGITNEFIIKNLYEGYENIDKESLNLEIIEIEDIEFENFNKIVLASSKAISQEKSDKHTGILLINKKENKIKDVLITNEIQWLIEGIYNNEKSKLSELTELIAKIISSKGTEVLSSSSNDYKNAMKEITSFIGIENSKQYIKQNFQKLSQDYERTVGTKIIPLFEKESAIIKYYAIYEKSLQFNSRYPIDERMYKYFSNDYSYRSTLNALEYAYGPAYETVEQYSIYENVYETATNHYKTLDEAKKHLNVEE